MILMTMINGYWIVLIEDCRGPSVFQFLNATYLWSEGSSQLADWRSNPDRGNYSKLHQLHHSSPDLPVYCGTGDFIFYHKIMNISPPPSFSQAKYVAASSSQIFNVWSQLLPFVEKMWSQLLLFIPSSSFLAVRSAGRTSVYNSEPQQRQFHCSWRLQLWTR